MFTPADSSSTDIKVPRTVSIATQKKVESYCGGGLFTSAFNTGGRRVLHWTAPFNYKWQIGRPRKFKHDRFDDRMEFKMIILAPMKLPRSLPATFTAFLTTRVVYVCSFQAASFALHRIKVLSQDITKAFNYAYGPL